VSQRPTYRFDTEGHTVVIPMKKEEGYCKKDASEQTWVEIEGDSAKKNPCVGCSYSEDDGGGFRSCNASTYLTRCPRSGELF
jgi:hypothetical protein